MSGEAPAGKPKVVILGGGVGAMTAAFELSREGWQHRYESITVYQLGWRLGGKGASGRGVNGRIEEHGLHVWFGFYENAFRMMRECYDEVSRIRLPDGRHSITALKNGFRPASTIVVEEDLPRGWCPWVVDFPSTQGEPGLLKSTEELPTPWDYLHRALDLAATFLGSVAPPHSGQPASPAPGVRLR